MGEFGVGARWTLLSSSPRLPKSIITSNYFHFTSMPTESALGKSLFSHTNVNFQVITTTNFNGMTLPKQIAIDYFFQRLKEGIIRAVNFRHLEVSVANIRPLMQDVSSVPPALAGHVSVNDLRYWFSDPPQFVSVIVDGAWPTSKALSAQYSRRLARESARRPVNFITILVLVVFLVPAIIGWWHFRRNKQQTQNKKGGV